MQWILFLLFVAVLLAFDLGIFNRKEHTFSFKEATIWSFIWIGISCLFGLFIYKEYGEQAGSEWFTAYVLEKSLSVDNLFVISLIFTFFKTPSQFQHRCLFWGIIGAIIFRAIFILLGVEVISSFEWILYIFGAFLIYSGIKIIFSNEDENEVHENGVVQWFKRTFKIYPDYDHTKFRSHGAFTLLAVVLLMIETTDIIFAVDSIPAGLCVSKDAFILYTSNIMAVLGLRALYFVLLSIIEKFWLLKYGIASVLTFIGLKMISEHFIQISSTTSLFITLGILTSSILLSLLIKQKEA